MLRAVERGWGEEQVLAGSLVECVWPVYAGFCLWFKVMAQVEGKAHTVRQREQVHSAP